MLDNVGTIVSFLVSKEQVDRQASDELLQRTTGGNVPEFLTAFLKDRRLTSNEAARIKKLTEEAED